MESILNSTLRIDYEWLPSEYGSCEERLTLADVAVFVGDHCATELDDSVAKTVRRSARLSALHLAQWFATNWWRLLWQPRIGDLSWQMSHKIGGAGGGYIWPDLSFSSNWESILVSSSRTEQSEAEPIRYLNDFSLSVPIGEFEKCIAQFIGGTVARLSETLKEETELSVLWREVMSERRDRDMSRLRKLEACMGYDPDEAPDELLHTLNAAANPYGDEAVYELAAAYRSETISQIEVLAEQARRQALRVRVSSYDSPFLLLPIHFMDRRVPVQRRYLAPLSGQHPERFLLYCLRRVPQLRQSLPLLVLLVVSKAPQKLADRRGVRYSVAPQHSLQCVILAQPVDILQPAPATDHAVDQGQDMIRLPVPLAALQHPYPSVDCARHSEPLDQLAHQHQT